jgi:hypothetical protein
MAVILVGLGIAGGVALSEHRSTKVVADYWVPQSGGGFVAGFGGQPFDTQASCLEAAQAADGEDRCLEQHDTVSYKPSWVTPFSILVGFIGFAAGGALLAAGRAVPEF